MTTSEKEPSSACVKINLPVSAFISIARQSDSQRCSMSQGTAFYCTGKEGMAVKTTDPGLPLL